MQARLGIREAEFDGIWKGRGEEGGREGVGGRGVRLVSHPLMIKTLSQSCRQPDCCVLFLFSFGGKGGDAVGPGCR